VLGEDGQAAVGAEGGDGAGATVRERRGGEQSAERAHPAPFEAAGAAVIDCDDRSSPVWVRQPGAATESNARRRRV
jgi:hypothetical protein